MLKLTKSLLASGLAVAALATAPAPALADGNMDKAATAEAAQAEFQAERR